MAKTLKDLFLALLNATLILIALCLFLGWKMSSTVNGLLAGFASNIEIVAPMRDDVHTMTDELRGLRADISSLSSGDLSPEIMERVQARMEQVDARMEKIGARLDNMEGLPQEMLNQSIEKIGAETADVVNDLRGCVPAPDNGSV